MSPERRFTVAALSVVLAALLAAVVLPAVPAAASTPTHPDWTWQNPLPHGNNVIDVAMLNATDAVAVGWFGNAYRSSDAGATWDQVDTGMAADLYAIDNPGGGRLYAAGDGGTVLRSDDAGATWRSVMSGHADCSFRRVSSAGADVVWVAGARKEDGVLFKTTDGGGSWQEQTLNGGAFANLASVYAVDQNVAWVAGLGGFVARTTNGGAAWTECPTEPQGAFAWDVFARSATEAWVVEGNGAVFHTLNGGTDWTLQPLPDGFTGEFSRIISIAGDSLWIVGQSGVIYRTDNAGAAWTRQVSQVPGTLAGIAALGAAGISVGVAGECVTTADGGTHWTRRGSGVISNLNRMSMADARTGWAVGDAGMVLKTSDGGVHWTQQDTLFNQDYSCVYAFSPASVFIGGAQGMLLHSADGGAHWVQCGTLSDDAVVSISMPDADTVWVTWRNGIVGLSTDGGAHSRKVTTLKPGPFPVVETLGARDVWIGSAKDKIWHSADGGGTWTAGTMNVPAGLKNDGAVRIRAVDGNILWAIVSIMKTGTDSKFGLVMKSADGGATWNQAAPRLYPALDGLVVADSGRSIVAAGESGTIVRSVDGGSSWRLDRVPTRNDLVGISGPDQGNLWACGVYGSILRIVAPELNSSSPSTGNDSTARLPMTVRGTGFEPGLAIELVQGNERITGTSVVLRSGGEASCAFDLRGADGGSWDVVLTNPNGAYATLPGAFHLVSGTTWYLAEGSNAWGFNTYITIQNPNDSRVTARVTYMDSSVPGNGAVRPSRDVVLPPRSQTTLDPRWDLGDTDFSTRVVCLEGRTIAVDRTMFWTGQGAPSPEGHSSVGVTAPARTWYLPEGSSAWGFETWTLVENPGAKDAHVRLTYMVEGAGAGTLDRLVPAYSRASFSMASDLRSAPGGGAAFGESSPGVDASVKVDSDVPVVAEQSVYRNARREGSCSVGTDRPSTACYLAEGSSAWGFTTYVLVQNPNDGPVEVQVTYGTAAGPVPQPRFVMPPRSRKTIRVNDVLPGSDFSTEVRSSGPVVAERSMYWGAGTPLGEACHASIGLDEPYQALYLPDGQTGRGWETYTLVDNPNPAAARVSITYMTPDGKGDVTVYDEVPAGCRRTYRMSDEIGEGRAAIMVRALDGARPVTAERSMYWNGMGAGTCTIGAE